MKFAVVTLGSAGDLNPFLAIARALQERGRPVRLLSQEPHRSAVEAEGVRFVAVAEAAAHVRTLQHPKLWHPIDGFGVLWRHLAVPAIGPTFDALSTMLAEDVDPLVVFASPLAAGARLAKAKWPERIRLVSGYTAPMGLRSVEDPMFLGAWRVPGWVPTWPRHAMWRAVDYLKLEPMARPGLTRWAERVGVDLGNASLFGDWLHGPDGGLALYPETLAPVPKQWRMRGVQQAGFPLFQPTSENTQDDVVSFISKPQPYAVAFAGSAAEEVSGFVRHVIPACHRHSLRVLVLSGASGITRSDPGALWVGQAPLPSVLPGASVFIHHGGVGSLAEGWAAGVPQLIFASAYDQFENGARLQEIGQAKLLRRSSAQFSAVEEAIRSLMVQTDRTPGFMLSHSRPLSPNAAVIRACDLLTEHPHPAGESA